MQTTNAKTLVHGTMREVRGGQAREQLPPEEEARVWGGREGTLPCSCPPLTGQPSTLPRQKLSFHSPASQNTPHRITCRNTQNGQQYGRSSCTCFLSWYKFTCRVTSLALTLKGIKHFLSSYKTVFLQRAFTPNNTCRNQCP